MPFKKLRSLRILPRAGVAAVSLCLVISAAGCRSTQGANSADTTSRSGAAGPPVNGNDGTGFGHVHGLALSPADGRIYAATHYGVFRLAEGRAERVTDRYPDTMGFAVVGPDQFLASGHPESSTTGPPHLGLVRSSDGARTWQPWSRSGLADFHSLAAVGDTVYGWNSLDATVARSDDGGRTWQQGVRLPLTDLAANPSNPRNVVAATRDGLRESRDGGHGFSALAPIPPTTLVYLDWVPGLHGDREPSLTGVDIDGQVWALWSTGWRQAGTIGGTPQAFTAIGPDRYLAATELGVLGSEDGGRSWTVLAAAR